MRIRGGLVVAVLTCTVLLTGYKNETRTHPATNTDADFSDTTAAAAGNAARTFAPGHFRFTTGLDKVPQHIQGPVTCDTKDDVHRIAIGDPAAGGVEIGLSQDESIVKYVDLGYREVVNLMLINDSNKDLEAGRTPPAIHKVGDTYFTSGYATGLTAGNQDTDRYFEIVVACP
jgi:hypothetical protein